MDLDVECNEYERAEITTVLLGVKKGEENKYINIFSVAEMCPIEQEKSDEIKDKYDFKREQIGINKYIYIARFFSNNPKDCLTFFRGDLGKRILNLGGALEEICTVDTLEFEPPDKLPLLVYDENSDIKKILPQRRLPFYVSTLMDVENKTIDMLTVDEFTKATNAIKNELGVDLCVYKEYFGAILLCMPNSILRDIEIYMAKPKVQIGSEMKVVVLFYEREEKSIIGGTMEITDERLNGTVYLGTRKIDSNIMLLDIPYEPSKLRVKIFNKEGSLIYEFASRFIKSINIDFSIKGPTKLFNIEDKNGEKSIKVPTVTHDEIVVGKNRGNLIDEKIIKEREERELYVLEQRREFIYFKGKDKESKDRAKNIVRELISRAKKECIICDPYLSKDDVLDFAIRVESTGVEIKLLSSKPFLLMKSDSNEEVTNGEKLNDLIKQLNEKYKANKLNCKVLLGRKKSPLHDRFIIIDKNAYILGSSLNEFGSRATTLFKVPNPKPLIDQAEKWFNSDEESIAIDRWIESLTCEVGNEE